MKVLISGATGLIGHEVSARLRQQGHQVSLLVRNASHATPNDLVWWPSQPLPSAALANFDAIIHLAGRPVATMWTTKARQEIRDSRVLGTGNLGNRSRRGLPLQGHTAHVDLGQRHWLLRQPRR